MKLFLLLVALLLHASLAFRPPPAYSRQRPLLPHGLLFLAAAAADNKDEASPAKQANKNNKPLLLDNQIVVDDNFKEWVPSARKQPEKLPSKKSIVMKFGGSSLADATCLDEVAHLIRQQARSTAVPRAVVCSAMGPTTDLLLQAGALALEHGRGVDMDVVQQMHTRVLDEFDFPATTTRAEVTALLQECHDLLHGVQLLEELSPRTRDRLVSYGERCAVRLVAARLNQLGVPAQAFDAWEVGIVTDSNYGQAKILPSSADKVRKAFAKIDPSIVAVVTGFIGRDEGGMVTTLGRGGDLSATHLGAALESDEIHIYKDVDGILTADPRVVPHAVPVATMSYEEASEMAHFGASVLHPAAMEPAQKAHVPVRVKNSFNPAAVGTLIHDTCIHDKMVTAITCKRDVKVLDIHSTQALGAYGFLALVFRKFEQRQVAVDVLASSEVSISCTLDGQQKEDEIQGLLQDLSQFADVTVKTDKSILTLIADVDRSSEVLAAVFSVFVHKNTPVEMMSQGASKVNISFIVDSVNLDETILALHKCFFEDTCARDSSLHERQEMELLAQTMNLSLFRQEGQNNKTAASASA